ncbi:PREDICTED: uncharacterized protein LOC105367552 [Ceratosolen solmsi marchali]|uniref:Uncharacterized protein LOC105367552 n=1 Tax=Ceratosolen solmsi marchali TaxID=326594 RepID=A0AAJ7E1Q6_9HYME|nr:PREDICTED: uncharacterized protein LOC105367552 [Ceratosolen solmsi marchali]
MNSGGYCRYDCITTAKSLQIRGMDIGRGLQERLKSNQISQDRVYNYEKWWSEKLRILDEKHTLKQNLTEIEAARILSKIGKFFEFETPSTCPDYKNQVFKCFEKNNQKAAKCVEEVTAFKNCVDNAIIDVSDKLSPNFVETKIPTYMEKFEKSVGCHLF